MSAQQTFKDNGTGSFVEYLNIKGEPVMRIDSGGVLHFDAKAPALVAPGKVAPTVVLGYLQMTVGDQKVLVPYYALPGTVAAKPPEAPPAPQAPVVPKA